ncbi:GntR family transcriptional regulator [Mycobacterium yunnanensis]|uniref:GntR family transcriptional regulator n=1 Tax=Mycobacterium yunnanensis TaxID=368477 RepID=A0A9X2YR64_9MYCO|nr:GntR family transcriptional regulator [Mycobacterium yunnanensis]MCV7424107.1 GntR family transcriptional regulator [Mycobacterium yunnanensis]
MDEPGNAARVSVDAGVPLHRQLYLVLHDEISRGALASGEALPTEQTLCDMFGVSRITVRRALSDLSDAGLVDRRHGVGSFVSERSAEAHQASSLDNMRQVEVETEVDVVEWGVRAVPPAVAARWDHRDTALHVLRVRHERLTSEPLMITDAWLPAELADVVTESALRRVTLYGLMTAAGVVLERLDHEMTAEIAGPRTASLLATAIGSPLIRVNRVAYAGGAPHHVLSVALSPDRSRVLVSQRSADAETGTALSIAHDVLRPSN